MVALEELLFKKKKKGQKKAADLVKPEKWNC